MWPSVPLSAVAFASAAAQPTKSGLTRPLESVLARMPARTGVYVKYHATSQDAAVSAADAFSSASVIKLMILVRSLQLVAQGKLRLTDRAEIRRSELRDGAGVRQYHDLGQNPARNRAPSRGHRAGHHDFGVERRADAHDAASAASRRATDSAYS